MLFDSHCHLTDDRLIGEVDAVIARARAAGVTRMVTVGTGPDDAEAAAALAARAPEVWASAGIHPHDASSADEAALSRIRDVLSRPRVVALGEIGLDYHYDHSPRDVQRRAFRRQLEMAADLGLPVIIHSREADLDTATQVREAAGSVRGVLHCFAGGPELLEAGIDAGWYVSFSGLITFKKFDGAALVRAVPTDRLLVETDSPYLAPVPHRGKRNEPAFVREVAEVAASLRGETFEALARRSAANAAAFYGLRSAG